MFDEVSRVFGYSMDFYLKRLGLIVIFSVPFIFAFLLPVLVAAPTYLALGGVFLRTGSIPEMSFLDYVITIVAYAVTLFIIADTIVNVNIVVRSKRTLTDIKFEVMGALGSYATRIFYIYTLMLLLLFMIQLVTYENPLQTWFYPIFGLALSFLLFFVPPAVVIDNLDTATAIRRSIEMVSRKPHLFLSWVLFAFIALSFVKLFADLVFVSPFSGYFVLLVNSLVLLPFLIVLQTQMYMEKYPLAR